MELPASSQLDVARLTTVFADTTNSYKFYWLLAGQAQRMLANRYAPAGFTVGLNIGAAAGQRMPHASLHVIPRYAGDVRHPAGGIRNILKR